MTEGEARSSSLRGRLALALGSVVVTLAVLVAGYEVAAQVRYSRWRASFDDEGWIGRLTVASPNPTLIWEYRPHGEAGGIATNRYGFRDVDYPTPDKPAGTHRIAFVGDSVTLGMGVPAERTFVARVGSLAREAGLRVETLNFGVDGYNTLQIRELLTAKVLAFDPDQVVYVMCLNDFDFSDASGRKIAYFRRPWLFLPQELDRRYRQLRGIEFHAYHFQRHREEVFGAVAEMKAILDADGVGFLLAISPVFPETPGDAEWFGHYPFDDLHQQIVREARQRGVRVHDLLADFRAQDGPAERYRLDLWHLSPEGHRVVAESLLPTLLPAPFAEPGRPTASPPTPSARTESRTRGQLREAIQASIFVASIPGVTVPSSRTWS
jgi:lysophospholipase L1-like esterase